MTRVQWLRPNEACHPTNTTTSTRPPRWPTRWGWPCTRNAPRAPALPSRPSFLAHSLPLTRPALCWESSTSSTPSLGLLVGAATVARRALQAKHAYRSMQLLVLPALCAYASIPPNPRANPSQAPTQATQAPREGRTQRTARTPNPTRGPNPGRRCGRSTEFRRRNEASAAPESKSPSWGRGLPSNGHSQASRAQYLAWERSDTHWITSAASFPLPAPRPRSSPSS